MNCTSNEKVRRKKISSLSLRNLHFAEANLASVK